MIPVTAPKGLDGGGIFRARARTDNLVREGMRLLWT